MKSLTADTAGKVDDIDRNHSKAKVNLNSEPIMTDCLCRFKS